MVIVFLNFPDALTYVNIGICEICELKIDGVKSVRLGKIDAVNRICEIKKHLRKQIKKYHAKTFNRTCVFENIQTIYPGNITRTQVLLSVNILPFFCR